MRVLTLFGTRPEVIKLAPVMRAFEALPDRCETLNVASGQHGELAYPIARSLGVRIDVDLAVGQPGQTPSQVVERVLAGLGSLLERERPDALLVQGDTATALAGALAGHYAEVPVGHVEAGMRSGDLESPFPEEMHRLLIGRLADLHFAATPRNRRALISEGVDESRIVVTGNPVVDSVMAARLASAPSKELEALLASIQEPRLLVLTTHRRESFGAVMLERLAVVRRFVEARPDVAVVFPVHLNPATRFAAERELKDLPRVHLVPPLDYLDFVHLLSRSWLIVSDSGGIQEEAPTLGRPVLVIRDRTERPEAIDAGYVRLVGESPETFAEALIEADRPGSWASALSPGRNPFGTGESSQRIVAALLRFLAARAEPV